MKTAAGAVAIAGMGLAFAATAQANGSSDSTVPGLIPDMDWNGVITFDPRIANITGDPAPGAPELAAMYPNLTYMQDLNMLQVQDVAKTTGPTGAFDWLYAQHDSGGLFVVDADKIWNFPDGSTPEFSGDRVAESDYSNFFGYTISQLSIGEIAPADGDLTGLDPTTALQDGVDITVHDYWGLAQFVAIDHGTDPTGEVLFTPFGYFNLTPAVDISSLADATDFGHGFFF